MSIPTRLRKRGGVNPCLVAALVVASLLVSATPMPADTISLAPQGQSATISDQDFGLFALIAVVAGIAGGVAVAKIITAAVANRDAKSLGSVSFSSKLIKFAVDDIDINAEVDGSGSYPPTGSGFGTVDALGSLDFSVPAGTDCTTNPAYCSVVITLSASQHVDVTITDPAHDEASASTTISVVSSSLGTLYSYGLSSSSGSYSSPPFSQSYTIFIPAGTDSSLTVSADIQGTGAEVVPEPGTLTCVLTALALLAVRRKRLLALRSLMDRSNHEDRK